MNRSIPIIVTSALLLGAGCAATPERREPPRPLAEASVRPETVMDTEHYVTLPPVGQTKTVAQPRFTIAVPATFEVDESPDYVRVQNYTNPSDSPRVGLRDGQFFLEAYLSSESVEHVLPSFRETYGEPTVVRLWDRDVRMKKDVPPLGGESEPGDTYLVPLSDGHALIHVFSRSDSGLSLGTLLMMKIDWKG